MLKYAVRRNLMAAEESERVIAEARAMVQRRAERAAERDRPKKPAAAKPKPKAKTRPKALKRVAKKPGRKKK
jgi:TPP-dependent pyruvate/acetoin dehydrogenase alpha subunit